MSANADGVLGVYLTFPDRDTAESIATALVERRLVACVNLFPEARSIYRWDGRVTAEAEVVAWAKSTRAQLPALIEAVRSLHPYDLPCVVAYQAQGGMEEYLGWVRSEVEPS